MIQASARHTLGRKLSKMLEIISGETDTVSLPKQINLRKLCLLREVVVEKEDIPLLTIEELKKVETRIKTKEA